MLGRGSVPVKRGEHRFSHLIARGVKDDSSIGETNDARKMTERQLDLMQTANQCGVAASRFQLHDGQRLSR
jgi:hypothetical protein